MLKLLKEAARVAVSSADDHRAFFLGAVAVREDQAIVKSANGASPGPDRTVHAEARALKKAGYGATVYVARVARKDGKLALARPCNNCWTAMKRAHVTKCYYTISENEYGIITFDNDTERTKIIQ